MSSTKSVKIVMANGEEKFLADLTTADLPNVKLLVKGSGKHEGETYITLKSEVIRETETHKVERRLFKWATMPTCVMYDLNVAKSLAQFTKDVGGEVEALAYGLGNYAIEQDKLHNGVTSPETASKKEKAIGKMVNAANAEIQKGIEALLVIGGLSNSMTVDEAKALIKKSGFGK